MKTTFGEIAIGTEFKMLIVYLGYSKVAKKVSETEARFGDRVLIVSPQNTITL